MQTLKKEGKCDNSTLSGARPQSSFRSEHSRFSKQGIWVMWMCLFGFSALPVGTTRLYLYTSAVLRWQKINILEASAVCERWNWCPAVCTLTKSNALPISPPPRVPCPSPHGTSEVQDLVQTWNQRPGSAGFGPDQPIFVQGDEEGEGGSVEGAQNGGPLSFAKPLSLNLPNLS